MTPYWFDDWLTVYRGDCREAMRSMEPESVHCVVTSPPYWGLRDYGTAGQLGLEATPEEYVTNMVDVFREVRRVLRGDGTVWLNLGDSYASGTIGRNDDATLPRPKGGHRIGSATPGRQGNRQRPLDMKHKDLVGIPWRVAFALQADGWYLRSDIIWAKPNPMPESVTDRPTKSHEYLFLLSKSARYYYDADAVREATFPAKLVEPCVKAGTSERGVCPECGAPWRRVVEKEGGNYQDRKAKGVGGPYNLKPELYSVAGSMGGSESVTTGWALDCKHGRCEHEWEDEEHPLGSYFCRRCGSHELTRPGAVPAVVLDPFAGSGTTGLVAQALGRRAILIDISTDYMAQIMARNAQIPLPA